jgi:hypothetical protein
MDRATFSKSNSMLQHATGTHLSRVARWYIYF